VTAAVEEVGIVAAVAIEEEAEETMGIELDGSSTNDEVVAVEGSDVEANG
jgi:hypothetical protein